MVRTASGTAAIFLSMLGFWVAALPLGASEEEGTRTRLLRLRREAVELLDRSGGPDVAGVARRLAEMGADPTAPAAAVLPATLRAELKRAALDLEAAGGRLDAKPYRALLERTRVELEGPAALGLTFQGSYSRTPPKEPVYGGHASAMGPAPGPEPAVATVLETSPVRMEEAAQLPTRTFGGGPTKDHILESVGTGVALFDYDGDGRLDIYLVTAAELTKTRERVPHRNALYRNLGGFRFEDVSTRAGVDAAAWGNGVCAGDYDGDGRLDLYVTNWGANLLFRNRGDGTFEETAERAGAAAGGWSTGCAFLDADADGDLDLYVARYVRTTWDDVVRARRTLVWRGGPSIMVGPAGLPGESDLFFENVGGRFVEATEARGLGDPAGGYGFAVVTTDFDDDGFVDLFVANDSTPNFLYRNRGDGRFESVGLAAGVAINGEARAQAGMGADAGDYDGDGRADLVLTAFAHDNNTVYRNLGGRLFEDATGAAGLRASTYERMGWGASFLDADLDGRLDLFVVNGHIFPDIGEYPWLRESYAQRNQLLWNRGGGRFADVSDSAGGGLRLARVGRGLAVGDLDGDGDPDLVATNMDDVPTVLENRQDTGHGWIGIRVSAPEGNRFGIGAKVTIEAGGRRQFREIRSGGTFLSQGDLTALFGLGDHAGPVDVEVRMPGGRIWKWPGLGSGRVHTLVPAERP